MAENRRGDNSNSGEGGNGGRNIVDSAARPARVDNPEHRNDESSNASMEIDVGGGRVPTVITAAERIIELEAKYNESKNNESRLAIELAQANRNRAPIPLIEAAAKAKPRLETGADVEPRRSSRLRDAAERKEMEEKLEEYGPALNPANERERRANRDGGGGPPDGDDDDNGGDDDGDNRDNRDRDRAERANRNNRVDRDEDMRIERVAGNDRNDRRQLIPIKFALGGGGTSGVYRDGDNVEEFITRFLVRAQLGQITHSDDLINLLKAEVEGPVLNAIVQQEKVIRDSSKSVTFNRIKKWFLETYTRTPAERASAFNILTSMRQAPGETVTTYYNRYYAVLQQINNLPAESQVNFFTQGLNGDIRAIMNLGLTVYPTLREAKTRATAIETQLKMGQLPQLSNIAPQIILAPDVAAAKKALKQKPKSKEESEDETTEEESESETSEEEIPKVKGKSGKRKAKGKSAAKSKSKKGGKKVKTEELLVEIRDQIAANNSLLNQQRPRYNPRNRNNNNNNSNDNTNRSTGFRPRYRIEDQRPGETYQEWQERLPKWCDNCQYKSSHNTSECRRGPRAKNDQSKAAGTSDKPVPPRR